MAVVCYVVKRSFICELAFTNWTQNANETDQTPCRASKMLYALSNKPNFQFVAHSSTPAHHTAT